jgi:hypothetical protein
MLDKNAAKAAKSKYFRINPNGSALTSDHLMPYDFIVYRKSPRCSYGFFIIVRAYYYQLGN